MPSILSKALAASMAFAAVQAIPAVKRVDGSEDNTALLAKLLTTPTQFGKEKQLWTKDGKEPLDPASLAKVATFNFGAKVANAPPIPGAQGAIAPTADAESFPILLGTGMSLTGGTLGPCGIFLPHVHPRAHEFFVNVDEGEIYAAFSPEQDILLRSPNLPEVSTVLTKDVGIVFPQGSIHFQINNSTDCKPARFYAVLSNDDAGSTAVLQDPTRGNSTVARREVGPEGFAAVRGLLPARTVEMVDQCLKRCNLN